MKIAIDKLTPNDKAIEESGLSYFTFSEDNFLPYLIWKFPNSNKENIASQNKMIFDLLIEHSKIKSLRDIDTQINKYIRQRKNVLDSIDLVRVGKDKYIWTPVLITAYIIAIEDKGFRNTLTLQHEREVLESFRK